MRKKAVSALCALLALLTLLSACGSSPSPAESSSSETSATTSATNSAPATTQSDTSSPQTTEAAASYRTPVKEVVDGSYVYRDIKDMESYSELRDPFLTVDGSRVETVGEFYQNKEYLRELMQHYVYGYLPPRPETVELIEFTSEDTLDGAAVTEYHTLSFDGLTMKIRITYPKGAESLPTILRLDYLCERDYAPAVEDEMLLEGRYAFVTVSRKDLCPDEPKDRDTLPYGEYDLGAVGIWAFGAIVAMDYIEGMTPIDSSRVAITGHSRDGKAAICAAAMDERFAAVIPNGSGCGGAGSFTVVGDGSETLSSIISNLGCWFSSEFEQFRRLSYGSRIPVDMIFALACIAPRPVLCTEASNDLWANPLGTYTNITALNRICEFLGYPSDSCGMIIREGDHNQTDEDWRNLIAFTDKVFYGIEPSVDFNTEYFDVSDKIPWEVPGK